MVALITRAQGIQFEEESSFTKALAKAKAENKLVFVDAYTAWCGPCRYMSRTVFPEDTVGKLFNKHFISLKLDIEKGEGVAFARKYWINSVPQFLFFSPEEQLVHYGSGGMEMENFMALGRAALDPQRRVADLSAGFDSGRLSLAQKYVLANALGHRNPALYRKVVVSVLAENKDWLRKEPVRLMLDLNNNTDHEYFSFLWKNRDYIDQHFRTEDEPKRYIIEKLEEKVVQNGLARFGQYRKRPADSVALVAFLRNYFPGEEVEYQLVLGSAKLGYYYGLKTGFLANAALIDKYKHRISPNLLDGFARWICHQTDSTDLPTLNTALGWVEEAVRRNENSGNAYTMALLMKKLGRRPEMERWATRSLELCRREGEDCDLLEELLGKL